MSCDLATIVSFLLSIPIGLLVVVVACLVGAIFAECWVRTSDFIQSKLHEATWWHKFTDWYRVHGYILILIPILGCLGLIGYLPIREALFGCEPCGEGSCVSAQERVDRFEYERLKSLYGW